MAMNSKRTVFSSAKILLHVSALCCVLPIYAAEYSITQHNYDIGGGEFATKNIYVSGNRLRIDEVGRFRHGTTTYYDSETGKIIIENLSEGKSTIKDFEKFFGRSPNLIYSMYPFQGYYYKETNSKLNIGEVGEEVINGIHSVKYQIPDSPYVKNPSPKDGGYLWVNKKTGVPLKMKKTFGKGRFINIVTWDNYKQGKQKNSLFVPSTRTLVVPSKPEYGFALLNSDGSLLLTKARLDKPNGLSIALCTGGANVSVEFIRRQEVSAAGTGRDSAHNFKNIEGLVYKVKGSALNPGSYCMIASKTLLVDRQQVSFEMHRYQRNLPLCDPRDIERIEKLQDRKVSKCEKVAILNKKEYIASVVFERRPKDILAGLITVERNQITMLDLPGRDDPLSTWRVEDEGYFGGRGFSVLFVLKHKDGIELGIAWAGVEGESLMYLRPKSGKYVRYQSDYLYQAPR